MARASCKSIFNHGKAGAYHVIETGAVPGLCRIVFPGTRGAGTERPWVLLQGLRTAVEQGLGGA